MNRRDLLVCTGVTALAAIAPRRLLAAVTVVANAGNALTMRWPDVGREWTDGIPLANGKLGAMVWARDEAVVVSLDRADVWDLRVVPEFEEPGFTYANLTSLRAARDTAEIARLFEEPFHKPGRGKLPLGRLQLGLAAAEVAGSALDLQQGTATIDLKDGSTISVLVAADDMLGVVRVTGPSAARVAAAIRVESPPFGEAAKPAGSARRSALNYGGAEDLGYASSLQLSAQGISGYASGGEDAAFAVASRVLTATPVDTVVLWTVATGASRSVAASAAQDLLLRQTPRTIDLVCDRHRRWWHDFWGRVAVRTGDAGLDRRWRLSTYHIGAAARVGGPPVPLQSPWTWDNGRLPAWKGDYHHDLNTQMTYWPAYIGNRPDVSQNLVDWLWATKPECERFARRFFGAPGLVLPGTADIRNRPLGGWAAYSYFHTTGAWLLHHFELHWRYFGDRRFLETRAYPYACGVTDFLDAVLVERPSREGLYLPAGVSPETNDNRLESWFGEWTNFDLALVRYAYTASAKMADVLGRTKDAARFRVTLSRLPPFARDEEGGFALAPGLPVGASHRHFSHLLAFYPLGLLDPATDPDAKKALDASLARLERLGTKAWMGYSFAWLASLYALAGRGSDALRALGTFEEGFSGRNGFHTNGDRSGKAITAFPGRLFTLDGGSAACAAVQELMLQGTDDSVRLFPAVDAHATMHFERLRARCGVDVSGALVDGRVTSVILSGRPQRLTISGPGLKPVSVNLRSDGPFRLSI